MGLFQKNKPYFSDKAKKEQYKNDVKNTEMCEVGIKALNNGDVEKAIQIYEELLKRKFDGTHPYRSLCELYHKQGRYNDEIRVIESLRKVTPHWRYKEADKYRWYDKRYEELKASNKK